MYLDQDISTYKLFQRLVLNVCLRGPYFLKQNPGLERTRVA